MPNQKKRKRRIVSGGFLVVLIVVICIVILIASFIISSRESTVPARDTEQTGSTESAAGTEPGTAAQTAPVTQPAGTSSADTTAAADTTGTADTTQPVSTGQDRGAEYSDAATLAYSASGSDAYLDEVYFFGDSTTYGLRAYSIFGSKKTQRVWTPSSGTLALFRATTDMMYDSVDDKELSLHDIAAKYKPKYLVITLGVNGISMMDEDYFKSEYNKVIDIIEEASPSTKIILQTMYPQSAAYQATDTFNNAAIRRGNGWIHDLAVENNLKFLNSYNYFLDESGYMDAKYDNGGDGMHFNDTGYLRMLEFVKTHPYTN